jgi:hypothetical protein
VTICPPGFFCEGGTTVPEECLVNYYCPLGTYEPIPCFRGTFCPAGTDYPIMCPLGERAVEETNFTFGLLGAVETACEPCEPGYFGIDPARLSCSLCLPGYVCLGGTSSATPKSALIDKGYECPRGKLVYR